MYSHSCSVFDAEELICVGCVRALYREEMSMSSKNTSRKGFVTGLQPWLTLLNKTQNSFEEVVKMIKQGSGFLWVSLFFKVSVWTIASLYLLKLILIQISAYFY